MKEFIIDQLKKSCEVKKSILEDSELLDLIKKAVEITIQAYKNGNKVLVAGNGGSAADAQHIAGEFVSRFYFDRPGLPAIALTTDSSILTAIGNDYGYENLFARQIQANGKTGDIFFAISTSGNSPNIIKAIEAARKSGIITIGFSGKKQCKMDEICDISLKMPSFETPRIQEAHITIGHIICAAVEKQLFGEDYGSALQNVHSAFEKVISGDDR